MTMTHDIAVAVDIYMRGDTVRLVMRRAQQASKPRGGARAGAGRPRAADADAAILGSALDLLEKHGYGGPSSAAAGGPAGAAHTPIYQRWPAKPAPLAGPAAPRAYPP